MFLAHPSSKLNACFEARPWQGVAPESARYLFVGLDANYSASLERSSIFQDVLAYHEDGAAFWRRTGVHHPFLLPSYRGDGQRYHRTFARIGFRPVHASLVSFVELLHVPTVGRSCLTTGDLDDTHLNRINHAIVEGAACHVFVSAGVLRLMRRSGVFPWLPAKIDREGVLPTIYRDEHRAVHLHLHFSNYGKFQRQLDLEREAISALIPDNDK